MKTQCSGCGLSFTGVFAFDSHRVGSYTARSRRCLSAIEMKTSGLVQKASGAWGVPANEQSARYFASVARARRLAQEQKKTA